MHDDAAAAPAELTRTWRPAPARPEVTGRLEAGGVTLESTDGAVLWTLPFAEVTAVRLVRHALGAQAMVRLEMTTRAGERRRIEINHPTGAPRAPLDDFMAFALATLAALARHDPAIPFRTGERRAVATTLVVLGIALAGTGMATGAVIAHGGEVGTGAALALAATGLGAYVALSNAGAGGARPIGTLLEEREADD